MDGYIYNPFLYHVHNAFLLIFILGSFIAAYIIFDLWLNEKWIWKRKKKDIKLSPKYYYYSKDNFLTRTIVYRKQFNDQLDDCGVF